MLTSNFTATSGSTATKPGTTGARIFNLVANGPDGSTLRRYAATASTVPLTMQVKHSRSGKNFKERIRSVIRFDVQKLDSDLTLTEGVIPSASAYLVIDRPARSAGFIINAQIDDLVGWVLDTVTQSGILASLYNEEA